MVISATIFICMPREGAKSVNVYECFKPNQSNYIFIINNIYIIYRCVSPRLIKISINILYTRIFILYYLYLLELVSNFEICFLVFYCISFYVFWITSPILIVWLFHNFLCFKIVKIKSKKFCYTIKNWYAKHRFLPWSLANGGSFSMCKRGLLIC